MKRHLYSYQGTHLVSIEDDEPECGIDWCDACGECLYCNGSDACCESVDGLHFWVVYEDKPSVKE